MVPAEPVSPAWYAQQLSPNLDVGRTTFVNTLCGKKVLQSKDSDDAANAHLEEGVRIKPVTVGKNDRNPVRKQRL